MKELHGDIFSDSVIKFADAICVTTNSVIKKDGRCVMGAGVALAAKNKYKDIDIKLAELIKKNGHIVQIIIDDPIPIISFPTKINYWEKSTLYLIKTSLKELIELTDRMNWNKVVLPRPGCHNGGLNWLGLIKPLLEQNIDERFWVISK
jgi:hypothetical protein